MATSRSWGSRWCTCLPSMRISPEETSSSPATMRKAVVLPQPDGPTKIMNSPSSIRRLRPSTALTPSPKLFETLSNSMTAMPMIPAPPGAYRTANSFSAFSSSSMPRPGPFGMATKPSFRGKRSATSR